MLSELGTWELGTAGVELGWELSSVNEQQFSFGTVTDLVTAFSALSSDLKFRYKTGQHWLASNQVKFYTCM